jgi:hypothetical protein
MKRLTGLFFWMAASLATFDVAFAVESPEFFVSEFSIVKPAAGVPITFAGKIFIGVDVTLSAAPIIHIHAIVDLGDLQRKIPSIIATIKLPTDNCASFSANNPVLSLSNPSLSFAGGQAVFHTDGEVAMWDCRENPVPNSKIEWTMQDIKVAGVKVGETKLPRTVFWPGSPIKNKLGTQPFSVDAPFGIKGDGGAGLQLIPGEFSMNLGGQYVEITKGILNLFKVDLNAKLNEAVQKSIDSKSITASIPKEFVDAGLSFQNAKFVSIDSDKALGLDIRADVKVTTATAQELARLLSAEIKKKF